MTLTNQLHLTLPTLEATRSLAESLAVCLDVPLTIALNGTLGCGKTQLVRFLAGALGVAREDVTSPTYVLMQCYQGRLKIFHLDFYRLQSSAQVWDLGIDELYEQPCLLFIEWADKFPECLPDDCLTINMGHQDVGRSAIISGSGPRSCSVVVMLQDLVQ